MDEEIIMKKLTVIIVSALCAATMAMSHVALGQGVGDCQATAGMLRYDLESTCYDVYGPQSGNWSVEDSSALDLCLDGVGLTFSTQIKQCPSYVVATESRPPFENREASVSAGIGLSIGIYLLLAI